MPQTLSQPFTTPLKLHHKSKSLVSTFSSTALLIFLHVTLLPNLYTFLICVNIILKILLSFLLSTSTTSHNCISKNTLYALHLSQLISFNQHKKVLLLMALEQNATFLMSSFLIHVFATYILISSQYSSNHIPCILLSSIPLQHVHLQNIPYVSIEVTHTKFI